MTQQSVVDAVQKFKRDHAIDPIKLGYVAVKGRDTMMEGRTLNP